MVARQKKAGSARQGNIKGFYLILGVVALVGIGGLGYAMRGGTAVTEPIDLSGITDIRELLERATPIEVGDRSAPVRMVVFSDFQCPYCGQFALQMKPQLQANQVADGTLHIAFYDFPLGGGHRHSFTASRAARCAGDQGKYWEYHDLLYGQQSRWSPKNATPLSDFEDYAEVVGLDRAEFSSCLRSDRHAEVVTANRLLGEQLGISGTPTVIVNNRRVANPLDFRAVSQLIEQELGG